MTTFRKVSKSTFFKKSSKFTVYYRVSLPSDFEGSKSLDLTVYSATFNAKNSDDALSQFEREYQQPTFVTRRVVSPVRGNVTLRKVKIESPNVVVKVMEGDGTPFFDTFSSGKKVFEKKVTTLPSKMPRWMKKSNQGFWK